MKEKMGGKISNTKLTLFILAHRYLPLNIVPLKFKLREIVLYMFRELDVFFDRALKYLELSFPLDISLHHFHL